MNVFLLTRFRTVAFLRLKHTRIKVVPSHQLIKVGSVALRCSRSLAHVAVGHLKCLDEIVALELALRFSE